MNQLDIHKDVDDFFSDTPKQILFNVIQCVCCEDVIESRHVHDFVSCFCGAVSVDGGRDYLKRSFTDIDDFVELSIIK
jgi:hypothetical protein